MGTSKNKMVRVATTNHPLVLCIHLHTHDSRLRVLVSCCNVENGHGRSRTCSRRVMTGPRPCARPR
jgi:hypothetical protein